VGPVKYSIINPKKTRKESEMKEIRKSTFSFLSHLHTDHFGDFGALYVGGLINGRTVALRMWGPSGPKPEWGTKYALEHWRKALTWDVDGRAGRLPASGQKLEINEFDTAPKIQEGIRATYDGPLTLANDMMVWNVTKDKITVRDVVFNEDVWSPPPARKPPPVDRSIMQTTSDWINQHNMDLGDIIQKIYDRANKLYGTNEKPDI
jgi:hypothetical protein